MLDFARNVPDRDITMIAPVAALVAGHDLHPALVDVLAQAALDIHSQGDLFAEPREFPTATHPQIPDHPRRARISRTWAVDLPALAADLGGEPG